MNLAPIILFVYNRPWHTEQTLNALMQNELAEQSILYIYADGPKENATEEDLKNIHEVRQIIRKKKWCREIFIYEKKMNYGLASSIIDGVTEVINKSGKVIVLEDDIITSRWFLKYMNEALHFYSSDKQVKSIAGYLEPVKYKKTKPFFLSKGSSWGWATWQRVWLETEWDSKKLVNYFDSEEKIDQLNFAGYSYHEMLNKQNEGTIDSWAIRFYASCCANNGLHLTPPFSLTRNTGFDGSGTHCGIDGGFINDNLSDSPVSITKIPVKKNNTVPELIKRLRGNPLTLMQKMNYFLKIFLLRLKNVGKASTTETTYH